MSRKGLRGGSAMAVATLVVLVLLAAGHAEAGVNTWTTNGAANPEVTVVAVDQTVIPLGTPSSSGFDDIPLR